MSEREETKNWWDYAYIKGGWAKFLFVPMAATVIWSLIGIIPALLILGIRTFVFSTPWDKSLSFQVAIISAAVCMFVFTTKKRKEIKLFISSYYDKNIGGYDCWFWMDGGKMKCEVVNHGYRIFKEIPASCFVIVLPLGGWYSQFGKIGFVNDAGAFLSHFSGENQWRIRIDHQSPNLTEANLIDPTGESMGLTLKEILQFLQEPVDKYNWSNCLSQMMENLQKLRNTKQLLEAQVQVAHTEERSLREERDVLLMVVDGAIERIDATQRFIKSDHGKKIRLWLITEFLKHLSPTDPRCLRYLHLDAPTKPTPQEQPLAESQPPAEPAS